MWETQQKLRHSCKASQGRALCAVTGLHRPGSGRWGRHREPEPGQGRVPLEVWLCLHSSSTGWRSGIRAAAQSGARDIVTSDRASISFCHCNEMPEETNFTKRKGLFSSQAWKFKSKIGAPLGLASGEGGRWEWLWLCPGRGGTPR